MSQSEDSSAKMYPLLAALIAAGAILGLLVLPRIAPAGGDLVDEPAPDFALPVVANGDEGARMKLRDLRGQVVVLDFWATWCGPCAMQAPILERIAQRYPEVMVLGINVGELPAKARAYAQKKGLSYPILADRTGEATTAYDADTLPTVVVIDGEGRIRRVVHGVMRESALDQTIRSL